MADFIPFKALRPKAELSHQVSDPPYDVLKLEEAKQMIDNDELGPVFQVRFNWGFLSPPGGWRDSLPAWGVGFIRTMVVTL